MKAGFINCVALIEEKNLNWDGDRNIDMELTTWT